MSACVACFRVLSCVLHISFLVLRISDLTIQFMINGVCVYD